MENTVEDIQNRVRNHLSPIQIAIDMIAMIKNAADIDNEAGLQLIIRYIQNTNLSKCAQQQIDWFISLGKAMDNKIADRSFDVEKYINQIHR